MKFKMLNHEYDLIIDFIQYYIYIIEILESHQYFKVK